MSATPARSILVVEDDDVARRLLIDSLRCRTVAPIDTARDGAEALHRIRMRDYALVLLDLMMPHMSGIDVLDSLNAMQRERALPRIIVITAAASEEIPDGAISCRCPTAVVGVFRKPVDLPRLVGAVEGML